MRDNRVAPLLTRRQNEEGQRHVNKQRPGLHECHMVTAGVKEAIPRCIDQDQVGALGLEEAAGLDTVPIPVILSTKKNVTPARNSATGLKAQKKNLESAGMIGKQNR